MRMDLRMGFALGLKSCIRAFVVDTGKLCLPAQVFGLERIVPAVFDEVRSALTELEIDLLPDVQHPVILCSAHYTANRQIANSARFDFMREDGKAAANAAVVPQIAHTAAPAAGWTGAEAVFAHFPKSACFFPGNTVD